MEPILSPLMIYFLVVKKGLSAKISAWCIPGAYNECRNSKLEAETGASLACKKCLFHRYI